jgi:hypothetical protein
MDRLYAFGLTSFNNVHKEIFAFDIVYERDERVCANIGENNPFDLEQRREIALWIPSTFSSSPPSFTASIKIKYSISSPSNRETT